MVRLTPEDWADDRCAGPAGREWQRHGMRIWSDWS